MRLESISTYILLYVAGSHARCPTISGNDHKHIIVARNEVKLLTVSFFSDSEYVFWYNMCLLISCVNIHFMARLRVSHGSYKFAYTLLYNCGATPIYTYIRF